MTNVFSHKGREDLKRFLETRPAFFSDFDGTLVPIATSPRGVRMRRRTSVLLRQIAASYPSAIISGRSREDVAGHLGGLRFAAVVGNHGMEWDPPLASHRRHRDMVSRWRNFLDERIVELDGVELEDKALSLSLHYRHSPRKQHAYSTLMALAALLPNARMEPGKLVINVTPSDAPDKGDAVTRLLRLTRRKTAFYLGDDTTDENVFTLHPPSRVFSIHIGRSRRSAAAYHLPEQSDLDGFLELLAGAVS